METVTTDAGQDQATEIRFFDLSSRIGRVRYLAYGWAISLVLLPLSAIGVYELLHGAVALGSAMLILDWIIGTPIHFTFMIRRLHDMGHSGWWCLVYVSSIPFSVTRLVDVLHHVSPSPLHLLVNLVVFGFVLMLLFMPGSAGTNRFGPQPPPNNAGVIALAWSTLLLPVLVAIGVVAYVSTLDPQKMKVTRAVSAARASVYPATRYYLQNHTWPVDLASIDGIRTTDPVIGSVATIHYPNGGYGIIVRLRYSGSVEVWTTDDGKTWHCGTPADAPLDDKDLPEDCREEPPPTL